MDGVGSEHPHPAVVGMGGGSALSCWGLVEHVSVTWCAYGAAGVLTGRVSPLWDLSVSLCALLACVNSLTSRLNREEGVLVALGVRCAFFVVAGHHQ
jgi:hypothetical protein